MLVRIQHTVRTPTMPLSLDASLAPILSVDPMSANLHGKVFDAAVVVGSCQPSVSPKPASISHTRSTWLRDQELTLPSAFLRECGSRQLMKLGVAIFEMSDEYHTCIHSFTSHESLSSNLYLFMAWFFSIWFRDNHINQPRGLTGLVVSDMRYILARA